MPELMDMPKGCLVPTITWIEAVKQLSRFLDEPDLRQVAEGLLQTVHPVDTARVLISILIDQARDHHRCIVREKELRALYPQDANAGLSMRPEALESRARTKRRAEWRASRVARGLTTDPSASDLFAEIMGSVNEFARELRVEWTQELLASHFALTNGTRVAWGDATIIQHEERRDMFLRRGQVNLEGASRHMVAIRDIQELKVQCLNDVEKVTVLT